MEVSVISVYDKPDAAKSVIGRLKSVGCREEDVSLLEGGSEQDIRGELMGRGFSEDDAGLFAKAVGKGKTVLAARTDDDHADEIADIMYSQGALDREDLEEELGRPPEAKAESGSEQWQESERQAIPLAEEEVEIGKGTTERKKKVQEEARKTDPHVKDIKKK